MAIRPLKELHDYELDHGSQDCRGWPVVDPAGQRIGTVSEMLVDTDSERVTSLVLDRGDTLPISAVSLKDGTVHARAAAADRTAVGAPLAGTHPATAAGAGKDVVVPVVEEQIRVGKRQVAGGGVRVSTKVEEKPVHEKVSLREERVHVERHPADRAVATGDREAFQERSFEVGAKSEEPVVEKRARVVEDVIVGKEVRERDAVVDDKVRRTDVDVTDKPTGKDRNPRG